MMKTILTSVIFCFCALIVLAGCQKQEPKESILVYTTLEPAEWPRMIEMFNEHHPDIEVRVLRDSTEVMASRFLNERSNPQADVIWGLARSRAMHFEKEGLLQPFDHIDLSNIRERFRDPTDPPSWYGIAIWMSAFVVNMIEIERQGLEIPRSMEDLLKPEYKGLIAMPDPNSSGTGYLFVNAILQQKGEEAGWAFLEKLNGQIFRYTHSGTLPAAMAASGEAVIGLSFGAWGLRHAAAGDPVQVIFPAEGSGWDMNVAALVAKDSIKPGAKIFLEWASTLEAMEHYTRTFPICGDIRYDQIPPGYPADPEAQLIDNDFEWLGQNKNRILDEFQRRFAGAQ